MGRTRSMLRVSIVVEKVELAGGSTNAIEVTTGLSGSWQQDIEHFVMPLMSRPWWSQSVELAGAFW
jgi:hypothetical protein